MNCEKYTILSQAFEPLKELAKYHPYIPKSEINLFLNSNESNFIENVKHTPIIYLIIRILENSHKTYEALSNRADEKINFLHNIKNEPTKTITNYLKKIEMANTLYSQIMFDDDTNYFPIIEKVLNDFKDNPSQTMTFLHMNHSELDSQGGAVRIPLKNGYKDLYTNAQSGAVRIHSKEYLINLKQEIIINYYYELLQAYPIIKNNIQKKLYTSASIKIFKLLQFTQFPIKPYRLKELIEELFIALEYPIKVYPNKIDEAYPFAVYHEHYVYKYPSKDENYRVIFTKRMQSGVVILNQYCEARTRIPCPYDFGWAKPDVIIPILS